MASDNVQMMNDDELVSVEFGCPHCGERHIDYLEWIDDDQVKCSTCGTIYEP